MSTPRDGPDELLRMADAQRAAGQAPAADGVETKPQAAAGPPRAETAEPVAPATDRPPPPPAAPRDDIDPEVDRRAVQRYAGPREPAVHEDAGREARHNARLAPNAETDDPGNSDRFHLRTLPGLREGYPTKRHTGPDAESQRGTPGPHNDDQALNSAGGADHSGRRPGEPPRQDASGNPLVSGTGSLMQARQRVVEDDIRDERPPSGGIVVMGNAPRGASPVGSASGTNLSNTAAAGTQGSMGQVGPGSSIQAAMGATDGEGPGEGTASGTWTREDPARQRRADDIPIADPRPKGQRPKSDA